MSTFNINEQVFNIFCIPSGFIKQSSPPRCPQQHRHLSFCPTSLLFSENSTPPHQKPGPSSAHDRSEARSCLFCLMTCLSPPAQAPRPSYSSSPAGGSPWGWDPASGLAHLHSVAEVVFPQPFWSSLPPAQSPLLPPQSPQNTIKIPWNPMPFSPMAP